MFSHLSMCTACMFIGCRITYVILLTLWWGSLFGSPIIPILMVYIYSTRILLLCLRSFGAWGFIRLIGEMCLFWGSLWGVCYMMIIKLCIQLLKPKHVTNDNLFSVSYNPLSPCSWKVIAKALSILKLGINTSWVTTMSPCHMIVGLLWVVFAACVVCGGSGHGSSCYRYYWFKWLEFSQSSYFSSSTCHWCHLQRLLLSP